MLAMASYTGEKDISLNKCATNLGHQPWTIPIRRTNSSHIFWDTHISELLEMHQGWQHPDVLTELYCDRQLKNRQGGTQPTL